MYGSVPLGVDGKRNASVFDSEAFQKYGIISAVVLSISVLLVMVLCGVICLCRRRKR